MSHVVEPFLAHFDVPIAVIDFPASQSALAKSNGAIACRFEVYYKGLELLNGFYELSDKAEQEKRFMADNAHRSRLNKPIMPIDYRFLNALDYGLPDCSGVALGFDRLFAISMGATSISDVMSFSFNKS